nr:MAG TPA: hypothetical protein [Caudoviricetes sp.]
MSSALSVWPEIVPVIMSSGSNRFRRLQMISTEKK